MPKRLCPFNENRTQMKTKVDMWHVGKEQYAKEVYEKTLQLMLNGAKEARKKEQEKKKEEISNGKKNIGPVFKVLKERSGCYYCPTKLSAMGNVTPCFHCSKTICSTTCSKMCFLCGHLFCPSCCSVNYDEIEEKVVCLYCI